MDKKVSVVILSAGKGTRMNSSLPKVLHKISGKEMLYYAIAEAKQLSDDIHIVLYHQAKLVEQTMVKYFNNLHFHIQDHENYPGTGGAIMGIDTKYDKILVLNGDMPLVQSNELVKLISSQLVSMSVLALEDGTGYGRVVIEDDKVKKVVEQKDCTKDEINITTVNAGVYCFGKEFLKQNLPKLTNNNAQSEYYITDLIALGVKQNIQIKPIFVKEESFKGVNSKYDLAQAEVIHQNRIKKNHMINGTKMSLPDTIYIDSSVKLEQSTIETGAILLGDTTITNSHIKAHSIVENSHISDSTIGPMARIRPQSDIKKTHIGNFVEVKKSTLDGVKAGHLSYLGDSHIQSGTNIGAGTITCNYDGKNKYKTTIGKNVFIGSNTKLIAPICIEDDTIIGAGSTITKDVKKGELALSRAKTRTIAGYFYNYFKTKSCSLPIKHIKK